MNAARRRRAWEAFSEALADAARDLAVGELLRVAVQTDPNDGDAGIVVRAYLIRHARHRVRIAVGDGGRLPMLRQDARLAAAGWKPPSPRAGPDHYLDADFVDVEQLVRELVRAFTDVWGLVDPSGVTVVGRSDVEVTWREAAGFAETTGQAAPAQEQRLGA